MLQRGLDFRLRRRLDSGLRRKDDLDRSGPDHFGSNGWTPLPGEAAIALALANGLKTWRRWQDDSR